MRPSERIDLLDRVGRELQARMSYTDIDVYLKSCGVRIDKQTSGVNSKRVYVKQLLADESDATLISIADDLGIDHGYVPARVVGESDTRYWLPGHFRLFLSHVSKFKEKTAQLRNALREFGVSGFVAHEDIEPTREWQDEIEKALMSMDALVAILTPGFKESNWTDQEVGVAVGRDVLVIPIRKGLDPYGFIAKYQGLQGQGRTVRQVAGAVFSILKSNPRTKARIADVLVNLMLNSKTEEDARHWFGLVKEFEGIPRRHLEALQVNAAESKTLRSSEPLLHELDQFLEQHGLKPVPRPTLLDEDVMDDVPF